MEKNYESHNLTKENCGDTSQPIKHFLKECARRRIRFYNESYKRFTNRSMGILLASVLTKKEKIWTMTLTSMSMRSC